MPVKTSATIDSPCHRTILALPWLLNGSLSLTERREVREHLIHCPACRAELVRTREVLALFGGEQRASGHARLAPAGRRAAIGQAALRRLAWAAMIASVLAGTGWIWLTARRAEPSQRADHRAVHGSQRPRLQAQPVGRPQERQLTLRSTVESPAPIRPAAKPRRGRLVREKTHTVAAPAPAPPSSPVIFATSFESGSLASLEPFAPRISSADFETGDLAEFH